MLFLQVRADMMRSVKV